MESKITIQMKKGIVEYIVLATIAQGEVYASDIIDILKKNDLIIVEGTLYPLLSRLKTEEQVNYSRVESLQWPPRKYYTLTPKGLQTLAIMRTTWAGLSKTVTNIEKKS